jgi:hypothetical protein
LIYKLQNIRFLKDVDYTFCPEWHVNITVNSGLTLGLWHHVVCRLCFIVAVTGQLDLTLERMVMYMQ